MLKWLFVICAMLNTFLSAAQLSAEVRMRYDSLYLKGRDKNSPAEARLAALSSAAMIMYQDPDYGLEICTYLRNYAVSIHDKPHEALAYDHLGFLSMARGNFNEALTLYRQGLRASIEGKDPVRECSAKANIGNLYSRWGKLDSAEFYTRESLQMALEQHHFIYEARAKLNLGGILKQQGKYRESLKWLEEALDLCEHKKIAGYYASIYIEMGDVNQLIREYDTAEKYYRKALEAAEHLANQGKRIESLGKLAELELTQKHIAKSKSLYTEALDLARNFRLTTMESSILLGLSEAYFEEKNEAEALANVKATLAMMEKNNISGQRDRAHLLAGKIYLQAGDYARANTHLSKAHTYAKEMNHSDILRPTCKLLHQVHVKLGNPEKALKYLEEYLSLKTIHDDEEAVKEILRQGIKDEYQLKAVRDSIDRTRKSEIADLHHEQTQEKQQLWTILALSGAGLLFIVLLLVLNLWRRKQRHNVELSNKNSEVEQALKDKLLLLQEMHHRVKNNMQLASSLLELKAKNTHDPSVREALIESKLRLQSIQLAHQTMQESGNFEQVEVTAYARELLQVLSVSVLPPDCPIEIEGPSIVINNEQVQAVGFILHELAVNSGKYAWDVSDPKRINVRFDLQGNEVQISYTDHGRGMPENFSFDKDLGFGLNLIRSLVIRQLLGTIVYEPGNAPVFRVRFNKR